MSNLRVFVLVIALVCSIYVNPSPRDFVEADLKTGKNVEYVQNLKNLIPISIWTAKLPIQMAVDENPRPKLIPMSNEIMHVQKESRKPNTISTHVAGRKETKTRPKRSSNSKILLPNGTYHQHKQSWPLRLPVAPKAVQKHESKIERKLISNLTQSDKNEMKVESKLKPNVTMQFRKESTKPNMTSKQVALQQEKPVTPKHRSNATIVVPIRNTKIVPIRLPIAPKSAQKQETKIKPKLISNVTQVGKHIPKVQSKLKSNVTMQVWKESTKPNITSKQVALSQEKPVTPKQKSNATIVVPIRNTENIPIRLPIAPKSAQKQETKMKPKLISNVTHVGKPIPKVQSKLKSNVTMPVRKDSTKPNISPTQLAGKQKSNATIVVPSPNTGNGLHMHHQPKQSGHSRLPIPPKVIRKQESTIEPKLMSNVTNVGKQRKNVVPNLNVAPMNVDGTPKQKLGIAKKQNGDQLKPLTMEHLMHLFLNSETN